MFRTHWHPPLSASAASGPLTPHSIRATRRAIALAAVGALSAVALPATAAAYSGAGSFDPRVSPPTYPGTSSAVDAFKLVGSGTVATAPGYTASQVQVAPRWVIGARHSAMVEGQQFVALDGRVATVKKVTTLRQGPANGGFLSILSGIGDLSIAQLDRSLDPPAGGFPLLMREEVLPALTSALPGYVLWSGLGGTVAGGGYAPRQVRSGWTRPSGAPLTANAVIEAVDGDSGSAGAWYPQAGARPVLASHTALGGANPILGRNSAYGNALAPSSSSSFPTAADWIDSTIQAAQDSAPAADRPALAGPSWTTLSALGIDFATLPAVAPSTVYAKGATPTSLTIGWDHPTETRIPRDGYRVTLQPGNKVLTLGRDSREASFSGLATGTEYTASVTASNANGSAPPLGTSNTATYTVTPAPGRPDATAEGEISMSKEGSSGRVDYCAEVVLRPGTQPAGISPESLRYTVALNGKAVPVHDGASEVKACHSDGYALAPGEPALVTVRAVAGVTVSAAQFLWAVAPDGPAAGTVVPAPTGLSVTMRRAAIDNKTAYCADVRWTAAAPLSGLPVRSQTVLLRTRTAPWHANAEDALATATGATVCGLRPGLSYEASVSVDRALGHVSAALDAVPSPAGAAEGTPLPAPAKRLVFSYPEEDTAKACAGAAWSAPAAVAGFPVSGYRLRVVDANWNTMADATFPAGETTGQVCGFPRGGTYTLLVGARYLANGALPTWQPGEAMPYFQAPVSVAVN